MISQPVFANRSLTVRRREHADRRSVSSRLAVPLHAPPPDVDETIVPPHAPSPVEESIVPPHASQLARQRRSGTPSRRNQRHSASSRVAMHGFVHARSLIGIRSPEHASALIRILELARADDNGLIGSLGHGNRTSWITTNRVAVFQPGGPLAAYNPLSVLVLMRHIADAETEAPPPLPSPATPNDAFSLLIS